MTGLIGAVLSSLAFSGSTISVYLLQGSNLELSSTEFTKRCLVTRVLGRHEGARPMDEVYARTVAGRFAKRLPQRPQFGVSNRTVLEQVWFGASDRDPPEGVRLSPCPWGKKDLVRSGGSGDGKSNENGSKDEGALHVGDFVSVCDESQFEFLP